MTIPERTADFLIQFIITTEKQLTNFGLSQSNAEKIATETCDQLRKDFGGEPLYFPMGRELNAIMQHSAIYKEFTGNNHQELAKKHGVTKTHVYRIIKMGYQKELDHKQPKLF